MANPMQLFGTFDPNYLHANDSGLFTWTFNKILYKHMVKYLHGYRVK